MARDQQRTQRAKNKPPSMFMLLAESRAFVELGWFYSLRFLTRYLPKGDGHPVITLPGFLGSDGSTAPLRGVLNDIGYKAHPWGLGRNLTVSEKRDEELSELLQEVYGRYDRKVSLVGWSLGGVFAREMAKMHPDLVRNVISLGSPITPDQNMTNAKALYEQMNGPIEEAHGERLSTVHEPPPVPTTSIFSKTDGVVAWQGSIQENADWHADTENIEVPAASHFGLGVNPLVMYLIADRLSQPEDEWSPFDQAGIPGLVFRQH